MYWENRGGCVDTDYGGLEMLPVHACVCLGKEGQEREREKGERREREKRERGEREKRERGEREKRERERTERQCVWVWKGKRDKE